jgi:hypothetical protein
MVDLNFWSLVMSSCYGHDWMLKYCYSGESKRMLTTNIFLITLYQFKHAFALDNFEAVGSRQGRMAGTCDSGNEPLGSTKCGEFLD